MKKALSILTAGCLAVSLAACGSTAASSAASAADSTASSAAESTAASDTAAADGQTYKVGICQLVQHVALDAATQGFKDALTEQLGDAVTFEEKNAQGDSNTCSTIINGFVSDNVDLILANATPALQAAQAGTNTIPVLGTSVTEYGVALGIDDFDGLVGTNISGTSDLAPLDEQAGIIKELFPDAKTVGLLYCSAEANSQYQVDTVKASLEELGYTCEYYAFSDSNDLATVCQSAADASDVIYVPTDNTVAKTLRSSITSASPPVCLSLQVRKASWAAVALLPCPSATMTWALLPARWPPRSWPAKARLKRCPLSTLRSSRRNTTRPLPKLWASPSQMIMWHTRAKQPERPALI